eukprot:gene10783-14479_t
MNEIIECYISCISSGYNGGGISQLISVELKKHQYNGLQSSLPLIHAIHDDQFIKSLNSTIVLNRCLVNVGDNTQKILAESRMKLQKLSCIIITSLSPHNIAGFPGIFLSLSDLGVECIQIIGPTGLKSFLDVMSPLINRKYPRLDVVEIDSMNTNTEETIIEIPYLSIRILPIASIQNSTRVIAIAVQVIPNQTDLTSNSIAASKHLTNGGYHGVSFLPVSGYFESFPSLSDMALWAKSLGKKSENINIERSTLLVFIPLAVASIDHNYSLAATHQLIKDTCQNRTCGIIISGDLSSELIEYRKAQETIAILSHLCNPLFPNNLPVLRDKLHHNQNNNDNSDKLYSSIVSKNAINEILSSQFALTFSLRINDDNNSNSALQHSFGSTANSELKNEHFSDICDNSFTYSIVDGIPEDRNFIIAKLLKLKLKRESSTGSQSSVSNIHSQSKPSNDSDSWNDHIDNNHIDREYSNSVMDLDESIVSYPSQPTSTTIERMITSFSIDDADNKSNNNNNNDFICRQNTIFHSKSKSTSHGHNYDSITQTYNISDLSSPPPSPYDHFKVTFLGTGSAAPSKYRSNSSILLTILASPHDAVLALPLDSTSTKHSNHTSDNQGENRFDKCLSMSIDPPLTNDPMEIWNIKNTSSYNPSNETAGLRIEVFELDQATHSMSTLSSPTTATSTQSNFSPFKRRIVEKKDLLISNSFACDPSPILNNNNNNNNKRSGKPKLQLSLLSVTEDDCMDVKSNNYINRISENQLILLDCGEGTTAQLFQSVGGDIDRYYSLLLQIKIIWISHHHADHVTGFPLLLEHIKLGKIRQSKMNNNDNNSTTSASFSYAHRKCYYAGSRFEEDKLLLIASDNILKYFEFSACIAGLDDLVSFFPIQNTLYAGNTRDVSGASNGHIRRLRSIPVQHCQNSYGVVIELASGHKIVYSGDCRPSQSLVKSGIKCDLLIHEATFEDCRDKDALKKRHCTRAEAVSISKQMKAKHTILTHFSQRYPLDTMDDFRNNNNNNNNNKLKEEEVVDNVSYAFDFLAVSFPSQIHSLPMITKAICKALSSVHNNNNGEDVISDQKIDII